MTRKTVKTILGIIFAVLFAIVSIKIFTSDAYSTNNLQIASIILLACSVSCFLHQKDYTSKPTDRKLSKRTILATLFILITIPLTVCLGTYFFGDKKYYLISSLVILQTLIPFCVAFEAKKPNAREMVIISILCAIAVAGRAAFYSIPQFKPVIALVIISGVCFGGEAGFLVGAITAFISNFFFGHGPWTQWQMFSYGIVGFVAGLLFKKGFFSKKTKISLTVFGFLSVFILYGGIMNPASVILWQENPTTEMILSSYIAGAPFDLVHAVSTAFFLWFIAEPMIELIDRIKTKYGLDV